MNALQDTNFRLHSVAFAIVRRRPFVPLTAGLTAKLKELYKVRYLHEPHVFLVNGKSVSSIKTAFNAACRRAKIQRFRFMIFAIRL